MKFNNYFFLLGGYTKWSKLLKKKISSLGYNPIAYSKYKKNNSELKKFDFKKINSFKFSILASNRYNNNKTLISLLKNNYKKPIFIEKPLSINQNQIKIIKNLNKNNNIFTNHQHIYSGPIEKIIKFHKKNKKKIDIFIKFGKKGPKGINPLLEWGPHVFSILGNFVDFQKVKTSIYKIKKNSKKYFNIKVKICNTNIHAHLIFGNNFNKKTYEFRYKTHKKQFFYNGTRPGSIIINNLNFFTKKNPLENSLNYFINNKKNIYKNNFNNAVNAMLYLFYIEKLYKKKFNFKFSKYNFKKFK